MSDVDREHQATHGFLREWLVGGPKGHTHPNTPCGVWWYLVRGKKWRFPATKQHVTNRIWSLLRSIFRLIVPFAVHFWPLWSLIGPHRGQYLAGSLGSLKADSMVRRAISMFSASHGRAPANNNGSASSRVIPRPARSHAARNRRSFHWGPSECLPSRNSHVLGLAP